MHLPTKRSDALAAGHKYYFNGNPCKRGHISKRLVSTHACYECSRIFDKGRDRTDRVVTPEQRVAWKRAYYEKHSGRVLATNRVYRHRKDWPMTDVEKLLCQYRYEDAQRLTAETGIEHHVDHIWPLSKGGPHLPWNLQVITAAENLQKSNRI
jgi:5-methylcytosine-specific restriction endonuclease McrA